MFFLNVKIKMVILQQSNPNFKGFSELKDILNEKNSGEYLSIFRGKILLERVFIQI